MILFGFEGTRYEQMPAITVHEVVEINNAWISLGVLEKQRIYVYVYAHLFLCLCL